MRQVVERVLGTPLPNLEQRASEEQTRRLHNQLSSTGHHDSGGSSLVEVWRAKQACRWACRSLEDTIESLRGVHLSQLQQQGPSPPPTLSGRLSPGYVRQTTAYYIQRTRLRGPFPSCITLSRRVGGWLIGDGCGGMASQVEPSPAQGGASAVLRERLLRAPARVRQGPAGPARARAEVP